MSRHVPGLAALACAAALAWGCKDPAPEPTSTEDRTLAKLRQEVDRVNQGGTPIAAPNAPADPNSRLAGLAAGVETDEVRSLPLASQKAVRVESLVLQPLTLESMHSLKGSGKVGLTTAELFVRVTLGARNVGEQPLSVTLSGAKLEDAQGQHYPIPRDAQTVGGTRVLDHTWDKEQSESLTLVFEVPPAAVAPGLALLIPTRGGPDARIPLQ